MTKKIIARISNGLGNQMFLYASSFAISKKLNRSLELDIFSGIENLKKKNLKRKFKHFNPKFELKIFNITSRIIEKKFCFISFFKKLERKILIFLDIFKTKKKFIIEHRNKKKITYYKNDYDNIKLDDVVYIEGFFESEKYFIDFRKEILKEFSFYKKIKCLKKFEEVILNTNSVSMSIRADRYSETYADDIDNSKIQNSLNHEKKQYDFILRSISYFKKNISNPKFFIFSDNPDKISNLFSENKDVIIINQFYQNKVYEDFYLMCKCKHFAVGPTAFHFWPAWLSEYSNKICVRPKDMNVSNNVDYWPISWKKI